MFMLFFGVAGMGALGDPARKAEFDQLESYGLALRPRLNAISDPNDYDSAATVFNAHWKDVVAMKRATMWDTNPAQFDILYSSAMGSFQDFDAWIGTYLASHGISDPGRASASQNTPMAANNSRGGYGINQEVVGGVPNYALYGILVLGAIYFGTR